MAGTVPPWSQTEKELRVQFNRWADLRGERVTYSVVNLRGHREVTLRYTIPPQPEVILTKGDRSTAEENFRSLYLTVEALRLIEWRGLSNLVYEALLAIEGPKTRRDPYEVLGVSASASSDDIEDMYRAKARRFHPDNQQTGNAEKFKELSEAYELVKSRA